MRESATAPIASPVRSMGGLSLVEKGSSAFEARAKTDSGTANACIADPMLARATMPWRCSKRTRLWAYCRGPQPVLRVSCPMSLAAQDEHGFSDEELINALANAAAIGYLITRNATVAGAEGGCQAEVGASKRHGCKRGMRAFGGTPAQCFAAASNALCGLMGLVCDPVAGLVEAPCQKRNATGVANAIVSAQIALAGIGNLANFDETVEAMRRVGNSLPFELRKAHSAALPQRLPHAHSAKAA